MVKVNKIIKKSNEKIDFCEYDIKIQLKYCAYYGKN